MTVNDSEEKKEQKKKKNNVSPVYNKASSE